MELKRLFSFVTTVGLVVTLSCEPDNSVTQNQISDATLFKISSLDLALKAHIVRMGDTL